VTCIAIVASGNLKPILCQQLCEARHEPKAELPQQENAKSVESASNFKLWRNHPGGVMITLSIGHMLAQDGSWASAIGLLLLVGCSNSDANAGASSIADDCRVPPGNLQLTTKRTNVSGDCGSLVFPETLMAITLDSDGTVDSLGLLDDTCKTTKKIATDNGVCSIDVISDCGKGRNSFHYLLQADASSITGQEIVSSSGTTCTATYSITLNLSAPLFSPPVAGSGSPVNDPSDICVEKYNYQNNGDGTVANCAPLKSDGGGLLWQRAAPQRTYTLAAAANYCSSLTLVGDGWRLPTAQELKTLVVTTNSFPGMPAPAIPLWVFEESEPTGDFWTSTMQSDGVEWTIDFLSGQLEAVNVDKTSDVRCVRSFVHGR
jgi:Protein of unknown function (DUF1566)